MEMLVLVVVVALVVERLYMVVVDRVLVVVLEFLDKAVLVLAGFKVCV